jgi:hypothetical protein
VTARAGARIVKPRQPADEPLFAVTVQLNSLPGCSSSTGTRSVAMGELLFFVWMETVALLGVAGAFIAWRMPGRR